MQKLILTDDMVEGMVLALPIKNKFGQVLLGANTTLESKHKNLFKTWGIESFHILSEVGDPTQGIDQAILDEAEQILKRRISWKPKNENEQDLINLGKEKILEKLIK